MLVILLISILFSHSLFFSDHNSVTDSQWMYFLQVKQTPQNHRQILCLFLALFHSPADTHTRSFRSFSPPLSTVAMSLVLIMYFRIVYRFLFKFRIFVRPTPSCITLVFNLILLSQSLCLAVVLYSVLLSKTNDVCMFVGDIFTN